jgi:hypothetical protein
MPHCPLIAGEIEDPARLKRLIKHTPFATIPVLERLLTNLGVQNRFLDLQRGTHPPEYRRGLIDLYVDELFADGVAEREAPRRARLRAEEAAQAAERAAARAEREAAAAFLEGRPGRSLELREALRATPWECSVCFESFEDPNRIYVTCRRGRQWDVCSAQSV